MLGLTNMENAKRDPDISQVYALVEQNNKNIERLTEKVDGLHKIMVGNGDHRNSVLAQVLTLQHDVGELKKEWGELKAELKTTHERQEKLEKAFDAYRNKIAGAAAIVMLIWALITFVGFQQLAELVK